MTFNQEYINQLAEGDIILQHTKLPQDLPLLMEILKVTFPKGTPVINGDNYFYLKAKDYKDFWWAYDTLGLAYQHLPIIHLHDFVSPTKEEKQTIDTIDARLKELEGLVKGNGNHEFIQWLTSIDVANKIVKMVEGEMKTAPQEEQPNAEWKAGEWAWSEITKTTLSLITAFEDNLALVNNQNGLIECWEIVDMVKPTEQEVGDYLIGLAKQRYPVGCRVKFGKHIKQVTAPLSFRYFKGNVECADWAYWTQTDGWAEVLPQPKEEWNVNIHKYPTTDFCYIEVSKRGSTLFTKPEAEKYQAIIKNALNGTN